MSDDFEIIQIEYRMQTDILYSLAEVGRESDQWDRDNWLEFAASLHDLLLYRNQIIGDWILKLQDLKHEATTSDIGAPLNLAEEERSLLEVPRLIKQGDYTKALQSLQMVRATNVWWRKNNLRLLLSHNLDPAEQPKDDHRRAFQHITLYDMCELVLDDARRADLYKNKSETEKQADLALQRKLAEEFEAPDVFLNEEREKALASIFLPMETAAGPPPPLDIPPDIDEEAIEYEMPVEAGPPPSTSAPPEFDEEANEYETTVRSSPDLEEMADEEMEYESIGDYELADEKMVAELESISTDETVMEPPPDEVSAIEEIRRTPHMDVSATIPIPPGTEFPVEVFADREQARSGELAEDIRIVAPAEVADFYLNVWLFTSAHFEVVNRPLDKLHIQRQKNSSNRLAFTVRARTVNELAAIQDHLPAFNRGSISAAFSYEGRSCGRVGRIIELDVEEQHKDTLDDGVANRALVPPPKQGIEVRTGEKIPDMFVEITNDEINNGKRFHCRVITSLEQTAAPWNLNDVSSKIVASYMTNFTKSGKPESQLRAALKGAGIELFQASPKNFQEAFWRLLDSGQPLKTIQVITEEPHFLWELMVPTRGREIRDPLGVEFTLARWVTGDANSPHQQVPITDCYVIAPAYKRRKLKFAEAESEMVCKKFNGEPIEPATWDNIRNRLHTKEVSLLHFACHGKSKDDDVEQTLKLADDDELTLIALKGDDVFRDYFNSKQPFVFLNACEVGRQQAALSGAGGFPAALIALGARAVIAPAWSVKDTIAHEIAKEFYEQIEKNPEEPFAAIFQKIRQRAYDKGEDTYAAYCFYGDPLAVRQ